MKKSPVKTVKKLSEKDWKELSKAEREDIAEMLQSMESVRDVNQEYVDTRSFGQFAADGVAKVAGSWTFIILFLLSLLSWP